MKDLLKNKKIVLIDLETTGLWCREKGKKDSSIIRVEALRIENGYVGEYYSSFVGYEENISELVAHITGINNEMLKDAPTCKEVLNQLKKFTDGFTVYARNGDFMNRFLMFYSKKFNEEVNLVVPTNYDKISETLNSPYIKGLLSIYNIEEERIEVLTYAKLLLKMKEEGIF